MGACAKAKKVLRPSRWGSANLLCTVPILSDDPQRESDFILDYVGLHSTTFAFGVSGQNRCILGLSARVMEGFRDEGVGCVNVY